MELTAREKIIVRAVSKKVENIIESGSEDIEKMQENLDGVESSLAKVFGDVSKTIMEGIIEGIENRETLKELSVNGMIDQDMIQGAISDAIKERLGKDA